MTVECLRAVAPTATERWRRGRSETISPPPATVHPFRPREPDPSSHPLREQPWFSDVWGNLEKLLRLGENWNGYGEQAISKNAVARALVVLQRIACGGPEPVVVPVYDGGIQIEWYENVAEIEVFVPPSGPMEVYLKRPDGTIREVENLRDHAHPIWSDLRATIRNLKDTATA